MKKLLKNRIITRLLLISFLIFVGWSLPVYAVTPLDHYAGLFNSWNIDVDQLVDEKVIDSKAALTKDDLQTLLDRLSPPDSVNEEDSVTTEETRSEEKTPKEDRYLLMLASQKNLEIPPYRNIIYICDTDDLANSASPVFCTSGRLRDIDFVSANPTDPDIQEKVIQILTPVDINGVNYYVIPRVLLNTPEYQKTLGQAFKALSTAKEISLNPKNTSDSTVLTESVDEFQNSALLESALYALSILILVIIFRRFLEHAVEDPKSLLDRTLYIRGVNNIIGFIRQYRDVLSLIFILLLIFYIPVIYALNIKSQFIGDSSYIIRYLKDSLNPLNFSDFLMSKNIFRLGFILYNFALGVFSLLLLLPGTFSLVQRSGSKLKTVKIRPTVLKWVLPVLLVVNIFLLSFTAPDTLTGFLILSVIVILAILLYIRNHGINYRGLFSKKEFVLTASLMTLGVLLNVVIPYRKLSQSIQYAYEPLIGAKESVLLFPYSKQWGKNVLFEPYFYSGTSRVFADGYLISSPGSAKIINRPLKDFTTSGDYLIVSGSPTENIEAVLTNPQLSRYMETPEVSTVFSLEDTQSENTEPTTASISITFNCNTKPSPTNIKMEVLSLNEHTGENSEALLIDSADLLTFPGCTKETGFETYEVPVDSYLLTTGQSVIRLRGVDVTILSGVRLNTNKGALPVHYLNRKVVGENLYSLVYVSPGDHSEVTAYSGSLEQEVTFNIEDAKEGYNLSEPINTLMRENALPEPFIIWTDKANEIIRKPE